MAVISDCGSWDFSWPWPRMFFLNDYILGIAPGDASVCAGGSSSSNTLILFEMHYSLGQWYAAPIVSLGSVTKLDQISIADFGQFYIVSCYGYDSNGVLVGSAFARTLTSAYKPPLGATWGATTELPTTSMPEFITSCNFKGQCVAGGILTSLNYDPSDTGEPWVDLGLGDVWWSGIGSMNFRPDEDVTSGFLTMPWSRSSEGGAVLNVSRIGDKVLILGNFGRALLIPYGTKEGTSGFGLNELTGLGIRYGNHTAGDDSIRCFIDTNNDLWLVEKDEQKKLGYREYMDNLTMADTIMSYVPGRKRFFISDGTLGYVLNEQGMYSTNQCISSAGIVDDDTFFGTFADNEDYELRLESDTFDFGQRGMKTLTVLEYGVDYVKGSYSMKSSVKFKSNHMSTTFTQSPWKNLNNVGVAYPIITGSDLRILLKGADYRSATAKFDHILVRLKMSDKRSLRGRANVG